MRRIEEIGGTLLADGPPQLCANLIALRRREGAAPFTLPGGPAIAAAGIVFCAWLIVTRDLSQIWILPAVVLAGALLRLLTRRTQPAPVSP